MTVRSRKDDDPEDILRRRGWQDDWLKGQVEGSGYLGGTGFVQWQVAFSAPHG